MEKVTKPNDWFVSVALNPEMGLANFEEMGLTGDNTQILSRDEYKNTDFVQDMFKTEDGRFNETEFNKAYDGALSTFNGFVSKQYDSKILDTIETSFANAFRDKNTKIKFDSIKLEKVFNPLKDIKGMSGFGSIESSGKSLSEIAQAARVKDFETGEQLDWTPNDKGGLSSFFRDTLVLAQWDEDGDHTNEDGVLTKHRKGDLKYNEDGDVYYETLGKRDVTKKQVLSAFNTITTDGSSANKWDIFDTDDKEQSIGKTIMRTALKYAPIVIGGIAGGPVGSAIASTWLGATATLSVAETLPMLYKGIEGLVNNEDDFSKKSGFWKALNSFQGRMDQYKVGVSEYSQQNVFTWENIINTFGDVGLQLGQQGLVAKIPGYFRNPVGNAKTMAEASKNIKDFNKLSTGLATAYMTITSGADSYAAAIQAGHSERAAGLIMLGTLGGLHAVMKSDIGQWPLKGIGFDEMAIASKEATENMVEKISQGMLHKGKNVLADNASKGRFMKEVGKIYSDRLKGLLDTRKIVGAASNEAIEEVSEEIVQDFMMALGSAAGAMGVTRKSDWSFTGTNPFERYLMSAVGGAMGGAGHKFFSRLNNGWKVAATADDQTKKEFAYYLWAHGKDEAIEAVENHYKKNTVNFGSKDLSATKFETLDNEISFLSAENEQDSQAWAVKNDIIQYINTLDTMLKANGIGNAEREVYSSMNATNNPILKQIIDFGMGDRIKDHLMDSNIRILNLSEKIHNMPADVNADAYVAELEAVKANRAGIVAGEHFQHFLTQGLLFMNEPAAKLFIDRNIEDFSKTLFGKNLESLSADEKEIIEEKFNDYRKNNQGKQLDYAARILNESLKTMAPNIENYKLNYSQTRKQAKAILGQSMQNLEEALNIIGPDGQIDITKVSQLGTVDVNNLDILPENDQNPLTIAYQASDIKNKFFGDFLNTLNQLTAGGVALDGELKQSVQNVLDKLKTSANTAKAKKVQFNNSIISKYSLALSFIEDAMKKDVSEIDFNELRKNINDLTPDKLDIYEDYDSAEETALNEVLEEADDSGDDFGDDFDFGEELSEERRQEITNSIKQDMLNTVNEIEQDYTQNKNFFDQVERVVSKSAPNPVVEYLNKLSKVTYSNTDGVISILDEENKRLNSEGDPFQYIISSENRAPLENLIQDITIAKTLIGGSMSFEGEGVGFVQALNMFGNQYTKNYQALPELTQNEAQEILEDLETYQTKAEYLLRLSEYNEGDKLREHRKIGLTFQNRFYEMLDEGGLINRIRNAVDGFDLLDGFDELNERLLEERTLMINLNNTLSMGTPSAEDSAKVEVYMTEVETLIHKNFMKAVDAGRNVDELIAAFYKKADFKSVGNDPTADPNSVLSFTTSTLSSRTKHLTDYNKWLHLLTILGSNSSDFKTSLKNKLEQLDKDGKPMFKYAPVFAQEYPSRVTYTMLSNTGRSVFNAGMKVLNHEKSRVLGNLLFISGSHGVGKTSATMKLAHMFVSEKFPTSFTLAAPLTIQANNLAKSIGHDGSSFNRDELLGEIFKKGVDYYINPDTKTVDLEKIKEITDNLTIGKVIYIDEVTHFTSKELIALDAFAEQTGRVLITFGDSLQEGKPENIDHLGAIKTPTMEHSMRSGSTLVKDNNDVVRGLAKRLDEIEYTDKRKDSRYIENIYDDHIKSGVFRFKYYEDPETGIVTGTKFIKKEDFGDEFVGKYISNLISSGINPSDIAIIYDAETQKEFPTIDKMRMVHKVTTLTSDQLQGAEFAHVIVMSDLRKANLSPIKHAKKLNTVLTRAKYGNIVLDFGNNYPMIKSDYNVPTDISETVLSKFREDRMIPLNIIANNNTSYKAPEQVITSDDSKLITGPVTTNNAKVSDPVIETLLNDGDESYEEAQILDEDNKMMAYTSLASLGGNFIKNSEGRRSLYILPKNRPDVQLTKDAELLYFSPEEYSDGGKAVGENIGIFYDKFAKKAREYDLIRKRIIHDVLGNENGKKQNVYQILSNYGAGLFKEDVLDDYDWANGSFRILYTKINPKVDTNQEIVESSKKYSPRTKYMKTLVYFAENRNDEKPAVITLAQLGDTSQNNSFIDSKNADAEKMLNNSNTGYHSVIIDPSGIIRTGSSTRLIKNKDAVATNLSDVAVGDLSWFAKTKPMIWTGGTNDLALYSEVNADEMTDEQVLELITSRFKNADRMAGRPVQLVSADPSFLGKSDAELWNYYIKQKTDSELHRQDPNHKINYPPKVSLVILTPESNSIDGFFTKMTKAFTDKTSTQKVKVINTIAHEFTGVNMVRALYEAANWAKTEMNATNNADKKVAARYYQLSSILNYLELTLGIKQAKIGDEVHIVHKDSEETLEAVKNMMTSPDYNPNVDTIFKNYYNTNEFKGANKRNNAILMTLMDIYSGSKAGIPTYVEMKNQEIAAIQDPGKKKKAQENLDKFLEGTYRDVISWALSGKLANGTSLPTENRQLRFPDGVHIHPVYKGSNDEARNPNLFEAAGNDLKDFMYKGVKLEGSRILIDYNKVSSIADYENDVKTRETELNSEKNRINEEISQLKASPKIKNELQSIIDEAETKEELLKNLSEAINSNVYNIEELNKSVKPEQSLEAPTERIVIDNSGKITEEQLDLGNKISEPIAKIEINENTVSIETQSGNTFIYENGRLDSKSDNIQTDENLIKEHENYLNKVGSFLESIDPSAVATVKSVLALSSTNNPGFKRIGNAINLLKQTNPKSIEKLKELMLQKFEIEC